MKTILIAGAGHGGLIAAAKLADAGYDVTVLEKGGNMCVNINWYSLLHDGGVHGKKTKG